MKSAIQRLNNISGQIEGVKKMVTGESECMEVLTQLKAIRSAITGVMDLLVESELDSCMADMSPKEKDLLIKFKKYITN